MLSGIFNVNSWPPKLPLSVSGSRCLCLMDEERMFVVLEYSLWNENGRTYLPQVVLPPFSLVQRQRWSVDSDCPTSLTTWGCFGPPNNSRIHSHVVYASHHDMWSAKSPLIAIYHGDGPEAPSALLWPRRLAKIHFLISIRDWMAVILVFPWASAPAGTGAGHGLSYMSICAPSLLVDTRHTISHWV